METINRIGEEATSKASTVIGCLIQRPDYGCDLLTKKSETVTLSIHIRLCLDDPMWSSGRIRI